VLSRVAERQDLREFAVKARVRSGLAPRAPLASRARSQRFVEGRDQAIDLLERVVVDHGDAQNALRRVDAEGFNAAVAVKMPVAGADFSAGEGAGQAGRTVPVDRK